MTNEQIEKVYELLSDTPKVYIDDVIEAVQFVIGKTNVCRV